MAAFTSAWCGPQWQGAGTSSVRVASTAPLLEWVAEFIPRQVIHLQQIRDGFPLISGA